MKNDFQNTLLQVVTIALLATLAFSQVASATEIHDFYTGVRQMGMGGAYTGVVNDETSLLSNPAGLGKLREATLTIADPELTGSFKDADILPVAKAADAFNMQGLLDELNTHAGEHFYAKGQLFPSIVAPNFGFGVLANAQISASVDPTKTNYTLFYRNDYAAVLGYNFRFFGGVLKVGVDGRMVNRTEVNTVQPANSTSLSLAGLERSGFGVGVDTGFVLTAPVSLLPSLSTTVRDIGTTDYGMSKGFTASTAQRPHSTPQTLDSGITISPILANHIRSSLTFEMHDVTNTSDQKDLIRLAHAGGELNFSDFLFLRAGFNEGYWTAGVEFATELFQLQAASYGEEVGDYPAKQEDRRWVVKAAVRF